MFFYVLCFIHINRKFNTLIIYFSFDIGSSFVGVNFRMGTITNLSPQQKQIYFRFWFLVFGFWFLVFGF